MGLNDMPQVGKRLKIGRLEKGTGVYKSLEIRELCRLYGVSSEETEELAALAERAMEERIWDDYTDLLPGEFGTLVDLEGIADEISTYQPDVMPGLLQTPDYARAVFQAVSPPVTPEDMDRLVMVRTARQRRIFDNPTGAQFHAVLNEAVLARKVGGHEVSAAQLQHIRALTGTNRVNVRVLTYDSGAHASMRGSFSLLAFRDPQEPDAAYVESPAGARLLNKPHQVMVYREIFKSLTKQSIPLKEYNP